jgi:hypothetical protein
MLVTEEVDLETFDWYGGAEDTASKLSSSDWANLEQILTDTYPEGMSKTELNDLLRFDAEQVYDMLGIEAGDDEEYDNDPELFTEDTHRQAYKDWNGGGRVTWNGVDTGKVDSIVERLGVGSEADSCLDFAITVWESSHDDTACLEDLISFAKDELNSTKYKSIIESFTEEERMYFEEALETYMQGYLDDAKQVDDDDEEDEF